MSAKRTNSLKVSLWTLIVLSGSLLSCSEERCPPPDDMRSEYEAKAVETACLARALDFRVCAINALESYALTDGERSALSSCIYMSAGPETTSVEDFEQARSAVVARCE